MHGPVAPFDIVTFLQAFSHCFTRPSFGYFQEFVAAFWLGEGRRTGTAVWRCSDRAKHFSNFHRFLTSYHWSAQEVSRRLVTLTLACLDVAVTTITGGDMPEPLLEPLLVWSKGVLWLLVALDDTLVRKFGRHLEGAGWQHDAMAPNPRAPIAFGHCWVLLGLLWPLGEQWLCLPWAAWLFRPAQGIAAAQAKRTVPGAKPSAAQAACPEHETKLALVARCLGELCLPPWLRLRIVADAAYGKKTLIQGALDLGYHVVSRLPRNAVLYEPPLPCGPRRGRPRKYGEKRRLEHFAQLTALQPVQTVRLYGQDWALRLGAFPLVSRALGGVPILLVVAQREVWRRGRRQLQTAYFFSTDLSLSGAQLVRMYAARFAIEIAFRDLKGHFGLGHYQCRQASAAQRHVLLCLVAYSWSQLRRLRGAPSAPPEPWRPTAAVLTTGQLRYRARQEVQVHKFIEVCGRHQIAPKICAAMQAELLAMV